MSNPSSQYEEKKSASNRVLVDEIPLYAAVDAHGDLVVVDEHRSHVDILRDAAYGKLPAPDRIKDHVKRVYDHTREQIRKARENKPALGGIAPASTDMWRNQAYTYDKARRTLVPKVSPAEPFPCMLPKHKKTVYGGSHSHEFASAFAHPIEPALSTAAWRDRR